jgi:hypothetical protein
MGKGLGKCEILQRKVQEGRERELGFRIDDLGLMI